MTATDVAATSPTALPTRKINGKRINGKLLVALKAIVWEGADVVKAAKAAGLNGSTVRKALDRAHVLAFLKAEREVLRAYVAAQNIHHARKMRDGAGNAMARLGAMRFIEQLGEEAIVRAGQSSTPGFVIVIQQAAPQQPKTLELTAARGIEQPQAPDEA